MGRKTGQKYKPPMIMTAHGIRTRGEWQKDFAGVTSRDCRIESYDYGRYGLHSFLLPTVNQKQLDKFHTWYCQLSPRNSNYRNLPCAVAHSFGTWIIANSMIKYEDIKFDKIIFSGSILPRDFDWDLLLAREQVSVVRNECGTLDPWPSIASSVIKGTGAAGSKGFDWYNSTVENVFIGKFDHGDFHNREHMTQKWIPFLHKKPARLGVLHGRNVHSVEEFREYFRFTRNIDSQIYTGLSGYDDVQVPQGLAERWIASNPDIYTFLVDKETRHICGYVNAMPVSSLVYECIKSGQKNDNEILPADITSYETSNPKHLYLMSIAIR